MKLFLLLITIALSLTSLPSTAEIDSLSQATNESGRLRMLSQRMAKAYLLKAMDVQPDKAEQQFQSSQQRFEKNLKDLKAFSTVINSPAAIIVSLEIVQKEWASYKSELAKLGSKETAAKILSLSDRTLMACEELVVQLEKTAQRQSAKLVNISGRQRMLSQRIAKFYNAISLSGDNSTYTNELSLSVEEFEIALNQLIESPDNTRFVAHKLKKVQTQWNFSKQGFKLLSKGSSTPLVISMTTETILKQMNDITALYEEIDNNKKKIAAS